MNGPESKAENQESTLLYLRKDSEDSIQPKRPFLQSLWINKENVLASGLILTAFGVGGINFWAAAIGNQELNEFVLKLNILSGITTITIGAGYLAKRGVRYLNDKIGYFIGSIYSDIHNNLHKHP